MKGTFNRKLVVVVVHQGIPDFEAECAKLIESGYKMHSSEIRLTSSEASYSAVFLLKETETFVNPLFEKWVRKAERRKAAIEMLRRWLYERPVINKQEESSLTLPLLEDIENILMVESSGIAQKFIPRDKWVKGVMKRIEKEVLHFTISNLPLLEENEGKAVASDRPELSASEFLENVLNGEWSNSCKGDFFWRH